MNEPQFAGNLPTGEGYRHWHYNPVHVNAPNTIGLLVLGIVAIILVIALLRERRRR